MKSRQALIRLHKWQVDDIRRRLGELEVMRRDFEDKRAELEATLADERRIGETSPIGAFAYPSFAKAMNERRQKLEESIKNIEQEIEATKAALGDAYRELKKIEVLEENSKKKQRAEKARREQAETDEVAIKAFQRREAVSSS
jgi:flagellar export protein FliJ